MPTLLERLARPVLIAIAVATVLSTLLLLTRGLRKDYSLEAFVASESESYAKFRRLMDEFVSNEFAVIAIQTEGATSETTTALVRGIVSEARSMPAVERATSIVDVPSLIRGALGERLWKHPLFVDNLISRDGRTTAILLQMTGEGATGAVRRQTVGRLKAIVSAAREAHPEARIVLAGPYVTLIDMYAYVDRDLVVFSFAAFALLLVTLSLVFRRLGPVVFSLGVSAAATVCTLGLASALEIPTTLITQMIVILVMVLSVANCVHLAVADDEVFVSAPFYDWPVRARRVLSRMAAPCAGVMVTTATGFGAVSISSITPVRMFGLLMVLGLGFALAFSLTAVAMLARIRVPAARAGSAEVLPVLLRRLAAWVDERRGRVIVGFLLATLVFASSLPWLRFESDFVKNFRAGSEVRRSYEFIEANLSPTGSMEIVVRRSDGEKIVSPESVSRLRRAGDRAVLEHEPIRKAMTLADVLTLGSGETPTSSIEINTRLALARRLLGDDAVRNFLNDSQTAMRMNLRVREGIAVQGKIALGARVNEMTAEELGPGYETEVTGLYVFYATLVADLWRDQFRSLGITAPAVLIVLMVVLRSVRAGLIAMIPTTLPIVFCLGAMGWTQIPVNMTTAMMLSVTMGIAVDDAVHWLWRFRSALGEKGDYRLALPMAHGSVGRACVFTTIVISGGFWILMLSRFLPTAYFGGLLGFTMCGALAANLLLLPVLVMVFKPFGSVVAGGRAG